VLRQTLPARALPGAFLSQSRTAASRMVESGTLRNRASRSRSASTAADKHQLFTSVFIYDIVMH
jgi:hypothetical protein